MIVEALIVGAVVVETKMSDTFYFVAEIKLRNEDPAITVIDLGHNVDYQRNDWGVVNDINYDTPSPAIAFAKAYARKHNLPYVLFVSRYDTSTSEKVFGGVNIIMPEDRIYPQSEKDGTNLIKKLDEQINEAYTLILELRARKNKELLKILKGITKD